MAVRLPNGGTFAIATTYGTPVVATTVSNASPPVVGSTAHGLNDGDLVVFTSGWSKASNRTYRVVGKTTDTFNLEGLDTTSTADFPSLGGAGSVVKASVLVQIPQILKTATDGGEQQFTTYQFLENDFENRIPTKKSAQGLTLTIGDDPTLPGYQEMVKANDDRNPRVIKFSIPGGSSILYYGIVSVNETPTTNQDEIMSVEGTVSMQGKPTRYAS